jgi:hypothetical protein
MSIMEINAAHHNMTPIPNDNVDQLASRCMSIYVNTHTMALHYMEVHSFLYMWEPHYTFQQTQFHALNVQN